MGDIHGAFDWLRYEIKRLNLSDCIIIQVGDFGIGFHSESHDSNQLNFLNQFLVERNINLYAIRGNHDNPAYFNGNLNPHLSNLILVPDYTVLELGGYKILFVGGATSIDRYDRIKNNAKYKIEKKEKCEYWEDEVFVLDEEKLSSMKGIDVVITHFSPDYCKPDNRNGSGGWPQIIRYFGFPTIDPYNHKEIPARDPNLILDLKIERNLMTQMFQILKDNGNFVKYAFNGHYHQSNLDINGPTLHVGLAINELSDYLFKEEEYIWPDE